MLRANTIMISHSPLACNQARTSALRCAGGTHMSAAALPCHDVQGVLCALFAACSRARLAPLLCVGSADRALWAVLPQQWAVDASHFAACTHMVLPRWRLRNRCEEPCFVRAARVRARRAPPFPTTGTRSAICALWAAHVCVYVAHRARIALLYYSQECYSCSAPRTPGCRRLRRQEAGGWTLP